MTPGEMREGQMVEGRGDGAEMPTIQRLLAGGVLCQLLLTWRTYWVVLTLHRQNILCLHRQDILSLHHGLSALTHSHASSNTRRPTRPRPPSSSAVELCLRSPGPWITAIDCKFTN